VGSFLVSAEEDTMNSITGPSIKVAEAITTSSDSAQVKDKRTDVGLEADGGARPEPQPASQLPAADSGYAGIAPVDSHVATDQIRGISGGATECIISYKSGLDGKAAVHASPACQPADLELAAAILQRLAKMPNDGVEDKDAVFAEGVLSTQKTDMEDLGLTLDAHKTDAAQPKGEVLKDNGSDEETQAAPTAPSESSQVVVGGLVDAEGTIEPAGEAQTAAMTVSEGPGAAANGLGDDGKAKVEDDGKEAAEAQIEGKPDDGLQGDQADVSAITVSTPASEKTEQVAKVAVDGKGQKTSVVDVKVKDAAKDSPDDGDHEEKAPALSEKTTTSKRKTIKQPGKTSTCLQGEPVREVKTPMRRIHDESKTQGFGTLRIFEPVKRS
jgi:hypothetical protein